MSAKGSRADLARLVATLLEAEQEEDISISERQNNKALKNNEVDVHLGDESNWFVLRLGSTPSKKAARHHAPFVEAYQAEVSDVADSKYADKTCSVKLHSSELESESNTIRSRTTSSVSTSRTSSAVSSTTDTSKSPTATTTPATSIKTSLHFDTSDAKVREIPVLLINDEFFDHTELDFSIPYPPNDPNSRIGRARKRSLRLHRSKSPGPRPPARRACSHENLRVQDAAHGAFSLCPRKADRTLDVNWFVLPPTPGLSFATPPSASTLISLVPTLLKWRLITFYVPFFMHGVRQRMAATAASCLSAYAREIQNIDWDSTWRTYTELLRSSRNRRDLGTLLATLFQPEKLNLSTIPNDINSAAAYHQINPVLLATAIESLALALNLPTSNLTAFHLVETRDFTRLARLILLDLDFLTDRTEVIVQDTQGRRRRVLTDCQQAVQFDRTEIKKAVFGCARRYFRVLEWDDGLWRKLSSDKWLRGRSKGERRVNYRLVEELDSQLDGQEMLEKEMCAQGQSSRKGEENRKH